ncbi:MAG: SCO family protein [Gemmatimonadetes bacterium]|nr:SCO family protein [Gemmatimonadota bacterium]
MNRALQKRLFQITTGVLLGLLAVFWIFRPKSTEPTSTQESYFLPDPIPAPAFTLTSHEGETITSDAMGARLAAVFFGYTSCPDVCPLTLAHLARVLEDLGEKAEGIQVLFVTVDPDRDTPERMDVYLDSFHPSFLGLTGTEEEIREVANSFGAFFAKSGEGDAYTVDHTARTFIVSPQGHIPLTFPVTATPEEMARDLTLLLEGILP